MDVMRNTKRVTVHRICLLLPTATPTFFSYIPVLLLTRYLAGNKNSILYLYTRQPKKKNDQKYINKY